MGGVRLICGVGVNDADYIITKTHLENGKSIVDWKCPYYTKWSHMIERVYSKSGRYPITYAGCSVCDEWLTFSNFRKWMVTQDWEGKCLDKDLLVYKNRIYGPETCIFVSADINNFINENRSRQGQYPIGVKYVDGVKHPYVAQIRDNKKKRHLGGFDNPTDAHYAWKVAKLEIAHRLARECNCAITAESLVNRYQL